MTRTLARAIAISLFAASALLPSSAALAGELKQMQLKADDKGAALELTLDSSTAIKVFRLDNPHRVVIDLPSTQGKALVLPAPSGVVKGVRRGEPAPNTLRLVLDTNSGFEPRVRKSEIGGASNIVIEIGSLSEAPAVAVIKAPSSSNDMPPPPPRVTQTPRVESPVIENQAPEIKAPEIKAPEIKAPEIKAEPVVIAQPAPPGNATKTVQSVLGNQSRKLIVAVDAGHGGKDPGAIGPKGTYEKTITLAVAKELARQINAEPGMKAVLIRDDDEFVVLQDRFMRARKAQADVFISIHADAAENHAVSGSSVYVLSTKGASSQAARWLADKENAADLVGGVKLDNKDRGLSAVLLDLSQSATMRVSEDVATNVLTSLKELGKAHKKEVERANFVVLRSPDVPSMLVETGFITNPAEEAKLIDPAHRSRLATAIMTGLRTYFSNQPPPGTWFAQRLQQGTTPQQQQEQRERTNVVARGETLSSIAAQHKVPAKQIRQANQKRSDSVKVGERLMIPVIGASVGSPQ